MRLILIAGALALLFSLLGTPALIKVLARRGYGQFIRDDGPSTHHTKRGTPTMGGIIIIFATIFAYFLAHLLTQTAVTVSALLIIGLVLGLGLVGFLDDYLKVSRQNSRGISGKQKIFGQVFFASTFGYSQTCKLLTGTLLDEKTENPAEEVELIKAWINQGALDN